jgi:hypothetical protein
MGDLKPLGSEKLKGDDKLKRILELTYYGQKNNNINESTSQKAEVIKETANGVYGIIKEKDGYYVKRGLNESSLDYIGGLFMKNKNKFSSYAEALKRLELLRSQDLQEEKKFVLNTGKPKSEAPALAPAVSDAPPAPSAPMASDSAPASDAPAPDASSLGDGSNFGPDDMSSADTVPSDDSSMGDDMPTGDEGEGPAHMKEVQRLCGKLGQAIREVQEDMESDDVKYVINMVLSAVDIQKLSEEDKEAIVEKFEPEEEAGMSGEKPSGEEAPEDNSDEFGSMPTSPSGESDMDETMDTLENLVNTNFSHDDEQPSDMDEFFYLYNPEDGSDAQMSDEPVAPRYKSISDDDRPNRLTTSPHMNNVWYNDKDQAYNDFDGADYDEEDFDDHDSYMSKHSDSIGDLRYKPDFERHKPIKVRTLRKNDNFDISPELTEINEAINTTLSKYFE